MNTLSNISLPTLDARPPEVPFPSVDLFRSCREMPPTLSGRLIGALIALMVSSFVAVVTMEVCNLAF